MHKFDFLKIRKKWNLADRTQKKSPSDTARIAVRRGRIIRQKSGHVYRQSLGMDSWSVRFVQFLNVLPWLVISRNSLG